MLKAIFGSKSIEKTLLFLLVNEECYAYQLQRALGVSTTPAQKALARLEQGKILISEFRGKARVYRFDKTHPLFHEMQQLLKKAYHELSPEEKKSYYYLHDVVAKPNKQTDQLFKKLYTQMKQVTQVSLLARSKNVKDAWDRKGKGSVSVLEKEKSLTFNEEGHWLQNDCKYSNRFCWTLDRGSAVLTLEHLRFGEKFPVFLFNLVPKGANTLQSYCPHLCGNDTYFGWLQYSDLFIHLHIRTIGLKKDENIEYIYT